jgi:hypothetical protein
MLVASDAFSGRSAASTSGRGSEPREVSVRNLAESVTTSDTNDRSSAALLARRSSAAARAPEGRFSSSRVSTLPSASGGEGLLWSP